MEGPDPDELQKKVEQLVGPLISLMGDTMVQVKDSAAWTIGRVCERCPSCLLNEIYLPPLLSALVLSLLGEPRVAVNACWAFSSLVEAAYDAVEDDEPATFCLSPSFAEVVGKLLDTTERTDAGLNNLQSSAYEALMDMIKYSAKDCYPVVQQTTVLILERLKQLLERLGQMLALGSGVSGSNRQQLSDKGSLLCAMLQTLLRKLNKEDALQVSDAVMEFLLSVLQSGGSPGGGGLQEDAIMTIGVLVDVLGEGFMKYMDVFKPFLLQAMNNVAEVEVCVASVGLVGDLCRNLSSQIVPYSNDLMEVLVSNLAKTDAHRSIKPLILSALGDMALAVGEGFVRYLDLVLKVLSQAAQVNVDKDNYDMIDYCNELRDGCLEAYTGIIQGLKTSDENNQLTSGLQVVSTSVPIMLDLIMNLSEDEDRSESNLANALGLLGDLCTIYGTPLVPVLSPYRQGLTKIVMEGKRSRIKRTKTVAAWAGKELKPLLQSPNL